MQTTARFASEVLCWSKLSCFQGSPENCLITEPSCQTCWPDELPSAPASKEPCFQKCFHTLESGVYQPLLQTGPRREKKSNLSVRWCGVCRLSLLLLPAWPQKPAASLLLEIHPQGWVFPIRQGYTSDSVQGSPAAPRTLAHHICFNALNR